MLIVTTPCPSAALWRSSSARTPAQMASAIAPAAWAEVSGSTTAKRPPATRPTASPGRSACCIATARDLAQHVVAGVEPVDLVVTGQVVDLDQQQRHRTPLIRGPGALARQHVLEDPHVQGAGHRVQVGPLREHVGLLLEQQVCGRPRQEHTFRDRFRDVVRTARLQAMGLDLGQHLGGDEDDRYVPQTRVRMQITDHVEPVETGHLHVQQDQVRQDTLGKGQPFLPGVGDMHLPGRGEHPPEKSCDHRVVVDDDDRRLRVKWVGISLHESDANRCVTSDVGSRERPGPLWWTQWCGRHHTWTVTKAEGPGFVQRVVTAVIQTFQPLITAPARLIGKVLLRDRPDPARPVWSESSRLWMPANRGIEITVVMPAYNPGDALRPAVDRLVDVMRAEDIGFELIVVSDGSTDGSMATLEGAGPEVRAIELPENRGKGAALHAGFSRARGAWVGFVDSDGDIDPAHLVEYLKTGRETGADLVYANKRHSGSISASSPIRKLISFGFSSLVGSLFTLGVNDTQTGCKLMRREVLADVLPRLRETRFAFDLELFVAASSAGYTSAVAAPVELKERMAGSSVSKSTIVRTLKDALTVLARRDSTATYQSAVRPQKSVYTRHAGVPSRTR